VGVALFRIDEGRQPWIYFALVCHPSPVLPLVLDSIGILDSPGPVVNHS
jgi:hypothetical protein